MNSTGAPGRPEAEEIPEEEIREIRALLSKRMNSEPSEE